MPGAGVGAGVGAGSGAELGVAWAREESTTLTPPQDAEARPPHATDRAGCPASAGELPRGIAERRSVRQRPKLNQFTFTKSAGWPLVKVR